ncbi:hypothetical protein ABW20_dc0110116 [Dactylellina cionopaga]|nr:hypothetical protein ABW20_dc0110116 [Dactylellina cionopaga]
MPPSPASSLKIARYVALAACTAVALACGTNYVYSAYAPQLARELHLSTTESNIIVRQSRIDTRYNPGIRMGNLAERTNG